MGIRFACHVCAKRLNIKSELAGKRGICPACSAKFRIPLEDSATSEPLEFQSAEAAQSVRSHSLRPQSGVSQELANHSAVANQVIAGRPAAAGHRHRESVPTTVTVGSGVEVDLLSDDPEAIWYVRPPSGGQYGPADSTVLRQWIDEGRVAATALLWRDGWPQWRTASEALPGLSGGSSHLAAASSGSSGPVPGAPRASNGAAMVPASPVATSPMSAKSEGPGPELTGPDLSGPDLAGQRVETAGETAVAAPVPEFYGRADVGTQRGKRSNQRTMLIGGLSGLTIALILVLIYLMSR